MPVRVRMDGDHMTVERAIWIVVFLACCAVIVWIVT